MRKDHGLGSDCLMGARSGLYFKGGRQTNTLTHQLFCGVCVCTSSLHLFLTQVAPGGVLAALPTDCGVPRLEA